MPAFGSNGELHLQSYDYEKNQRVDKGDVSLYLVGKNIADRPHDLTYLLSETLHSVHGNPFTFGYVVGKNLAEEEHLSMQSRHILFALGILAGFACGSQYQDSRNLAAIQTARHITADLESNSLPLKLPVNFLPIDYP